MLPLPMLMIMLLLPIVVLHRVLVHSRVLNDRTQLPRRLVVFLSISPPLFSLLAALVLERLHLHQPPVLLKCAHRHLEHVGEGEAA